MEFRNVEVSGFPAAIRGMRNPFMSHHKSDSEYVYYEGKKVFFKVGKNDLNLMKRLCKGGSEHRKFARMIQVSFDLVAPNYMLNEFDTYKISTTRNSSSLQHMGSKRDYTAEDFTFESLVLKDEDFLTTYLNKINEYRRLYKETNDYTYFRAMRQLIGMGYNYTITWSGNYENIWNMYQQRCVHPHRLTEWSKDFKEFAESLPYFKEIFIDSYNEKNRVSDNIKPINDRVEGSKNNDCKLLKSILESFNKKYTKVTKVPKVNNIDECVLNFSNELGHNFEMKFDNELLDTSILEVGTIYDIKNLLKENE